MIRVVAFLVALALIAGGFAWFADRPGDIVLTWMGYRIETSLMVALTALLVLVIATIIIWSILRGIWRAPEQVSLFFRHRRAMKGYLAITRGLIAIGSGDLRLARRSADDAGRLSPGDPLALLLEAQAAQMAGDRAGAEQAFRAMARRDETKLLGLRGLYIEAQRRSDHAAARRVAEEAAQVAPALGWAGQAVLDDRCAASDWDGALVSLENMKSGVEKADYRRKRAVLLTARALLREESDRDGSRADVMEAVKLAPELVPAAALAGRRLAEAGEQRKARRMLERAWIASPHPDLAEAYADLRLGDSAREKLARVQKLAAMAPGHIEGALAVARAALDARQFGTARAALERYLAAPTQRVAALMASIEEAEHGDTGRVREWMARAVRASGDPVWTADGVVSDKWLPVTPSGRLDGFEWRVPLAEIGVTRPVIEMLPPDVEPVTEAPREPEPRPAAEPAAADANPVRPPRPRPAEPVIPLVRVPDDPGPGAGLEAEPGPEAVVPADGQRWQKIKDLFK
ncbi:MAG TPA: heme biosynthesis HemY N-terminal domain-containing protein [Pseudolabrys sp.]|nr:heme biosynthesis HemY N-terminal domain-containing protein [Pseudolabrys sp.]